MAMETLQELATFHIPERTSAISTGSQDLQKKERPKVAKTAYGLLIQTVDNLTKATKTFEIQAIYHPLIANSGKTQDLAICGNAIQMPLKASPYF